MIGRPIASLSATLNYQKYTDKYYDYPARSRDISPDTNSTSEHNFHSAMYKVKTV
jgi:hypothetical protein